MRIDAYNAINQLYQLNNESGTKSAKQEKSSSRDAFDISQLGRDLQTAKPAVKSAADIREDKIAAIKAGMASGTYNVSAEEIADKLVKGFFDTEI